MLRGWINRLFGDRGERAAEKFLRRLGYKIVARNVRNRLGEIDILALDGRTLVFVEVKTRKSDAAGNPAEAVTEAKQKQLVRAASAYLTSQGLHGQPVRFDVVTVIWPERERTPEITHFKHAFEAGLDN
jgi:putative endonuclease